MPRRAGKSWRAVAGLAFVADAMSVRARAVVPSDSIEWFSRSRIRAGNAHVKSSGRTNDD
jgi:hypothetical protein